jgi:predicted GIY-YIG superfamily endonuclease
VGESLKNKTRQSLIHKAKTQRKLKYNIENIKKVSILCETKNEFIQRFPNEYDAAHKYKWLDEVCSHMDKFKFIWTKEECHQKALLCKNRLEFANLYPNEYSACRRNKWLDEVCSHMEKLRFFYSKEECHQKALLCNKIIEFQTKYYNYYRKAYKEKWLDEVCSHMEKLRFFYSKEECHQKALLCKTRSEFQTKYNNFYKKAYKEKWLDEICSHMISLINQYDYDRIIYAYIFEETNSIYIGLTKNFKQRHSIRKSTKNDSVMKYINKTKLKPKIKFLTNFISAKEAQIKEQEFINKYRSENWNILNKQKAGSLGGGKQLNIVEEL